MKIFRSQLLKRTFLSYMAFFCGCLLIFAVFTFRDIQRKSREEIEQDCLRSAHSMALFMDENFSRIQSAAVKLAQFPWVWNLSVSEGTFEDFFDPVRRQEIINNLKILTENDNLLQNLTLIYPQKDLVVTARGWYDFELYLGKVKSDLPQLRESVAQRHDFSVIYLDREMMNKPPLIWMMNTVDYASTPKIQLAFSFDKEILAGWVSKISFSRLCSLTLYSAGGEPLVELAGPGGSGRQGFQTVSIPSKNFGWSYEFSYDPVLREIPLKQLKQWCRIFALVLVIGPVAAWLLTYISYRPLKLLLEKLGQSRNKGSFNECRILEDAFRQLTEDNSNMKQQVFEYGEFVQHDVSIRLLKGYFDPVETGRELSYYGIDYTEENRFCVLIAYIVDLGETDPSAAGMDSRMMATLLLRQMLEDGPYQSRLIRVLDEDAVIILSDQKKPLEDAALDHYLSELKDTAVFSLELWRGGIEPRIIGISKSYHTARDKRLAALVPAAPATEAPAVPAVSFYYPTDWEVQLINGVKAGNAELVARILKELQQENMNRNLTAGVQAALFTSLEDTVFRLATELNEQAIPARPGPEAGSQAAWDWVAQCLGQICQRMNRTGPDAQETGRKVLEYVQQNFESSDLSLKAIAQELGISLSTASKAFKSIAQMNFYDYTCRLRMEKVKQLLQEGHFSVRELCRQVGYENEHSLRRAFQRYEGISIPEYREKLREETKGRG